MYVSMFCDESQVMRALLSDIFRTLDILMQFLNFLQLVCLWVQRLKQFTTTGPADSRRKLHQFLVSLCPGQWNLLPSIY